MTAVPSGCRFPPPNGSLYRRLFWVPFYWRVPVPGPMPAPSDVRQFIYKGPPLPRADKFLAEEIPHVSRTYIQRLIENGQFTINDHVTRTRAAIKPGDILHLTLPTIFSLPKT